MSRRRGRPGDPRRAVVYLRASTEDQALGLAAQRAAVERWAAGAGVELVAWHTDEGVSGGAALERRPALLAALEQLAPLGAGVLVVARRDRLARETMTAALVERMAERDGARIVSAAGEGTATDDPAAVLQRRMVDLFAEYERLVIRARTRAALAVKRGRGERTTGRMPWGTTLHPDGVRVMVDDTELALERRLLELHEKGLSVRAVVRQLGAEGFRNRAGKPPTKSLVQRVLQARVSPTTTPTG